MIRIPQSLQARFAILFAVLIILLTVIISATIGWRSSDNMKEEIGTSLAETAYQMADKLDQHMWARAGEITLLSQLDTVRRLDNVEPLLNGLKKSFPSFSWVGLTDINGRVVGGTDGILTGVDISQRPVYQEGLKGQFIGDVHNAVLLEKMLPNPSGEPMKFVDISTPVKGPDGETVGVLAAHLSWAWVSEIRQSIMEPLKDHKQLDVFIVSYQDGTILLGPKDMIGQKLMLDSSSLARQGGNGWLIEKWPDGNEYLTGYAFGKGYADYKGLGWSVLVRQPVEIAFTPVRNLQLSIWIIGGAFSIIFASIGWLMANAIAKPLREITRAADQLRFGGTVEVPEHQGIREIEILASTLRALTNSLSDTEHELGKMEVIASCDRLTGLANRVALDKFLNTATAIGQRHTLDLVFLYLDLDGFKDINDTMGHHAGDLLLKEVAVRLKVVIREEEMAARLGGDEFLVVLYAEPTKSLTMATIVGQRIINTLNVPYLIEGGTAKVSCSIGAAIWKQGNQEIKDVINEADEALYKAKREGKNRMVLSKEHSTASAIS